MKNNINKKTICYIVLLFIQMCFCGVWIFKSALNIPITFESSLYQEAARSMVTDEYTGVLYPVFLRCFYLPFSGPIGRGIVALVQLVSMVFSILFFLRLFEDKLTKMSKLLICLFTISFPVIAHIIFLMTPEAFALGSSFVFLRLMLTKGSDKKGEDKKREDKKRLIKQMLVYVAVGFLSIRYAYFLGFIWLGYIIFVNRKRLIGNLLILLSGVVLIVGLYTTLVTPGAYGRMPASMGTGLVCNFSYEVIVHDHYFWPEAVKKVIPFESLGNILMDRSHVITYMGQPLLEEYSYLKTDMYGWGIAKASIFVRSRETIDRFFSNATEYLLTPITFLENLDGKGKSSTAINLLSMGGGNEKLAVVYMLVGLIVVFVLLAITCFPSAESASGETYISAVNSFIMIYLVLVILNALFAFNYFDYMLMMPAIGMGIVLLAVRRFLHAESDV